MYWKVGGAILSVLVLTTGGCFSAPRGTPDVSSPDPSLKIQGIAKAVSEKDRVKAQQMVIDLNNDDAAVRFYAIEGLQRLTGETFGYRYYDDEDQRRPAIKRWNDWMKEQEIAKK